MNESFNVGIIGNYEARVKDKLATVCLKQIDNGDNRTSGMRLWYLYAKPQVITNSEARCSIVITPCSNADNGSVEPVTVRRKQNRLSPPVWMAGLPGVAGMTCGEGYSDEDGRDCIAPVKTVLCMRLIKNPLAGSYYAHYNAEVMVPINGSETAPEGMQPVGQEHNRSEIFVMKMDAKVPDFCKRFAGSSRLQIHPNVKGRM